MAQLRAILAVAAASLLACRAETQFNSTGAQVLDAQPGSESIRDFDQRQAEQVVQKAFSFLSTTKNQEAVALGTFVAGVFMVNNGEAAFKYVVVACTFFLVGSSTFYELNQVWGEGSEKLRLILAAEAAALTSYIVYAGYEGVKLLMGAALGIALALKAREGMGQVTPLMDTIMVTLCVGLGVSAFGKKQNTMIMGLIMPFIGGFLVSSSAGYGMAYFVRQNSDGLTQQGWTLDAKGDNVIEFMKALVEANAPHVGIFGAYPSPKVGGHELDMDKVAGFALWFVAFFVGFQKTRNTNARVEALALYKPLLP